MHRTMESLVSYRARWVSATYLLSTITRSVWSEHLIILYTLRAHLLKTAYIMSDWPFAFWFSQYCHQRLVYFPFLNRIWCRAQKWPVYAWPGRAKPWAEACTPGFRYEREHCRLQLPLSPRSYYHFTIIMYWMFIGGDRVRFLGIYCSPFCCRGLAFCQLKEALFRAQPIDWWDPFQFQLRRKRLTEGWMPFGLQLRIHMPSLSWTPWKSTPSFRTYFHDFLCAICSFTTS